MSKQILTKVKQPQDAAAIETVPTKTSGTKKSIIDGEIAVTTESGEVVEDARESSPTVRKRQIEVRLLELTDEFRFRAEENKETIARYEELYRQYIDDYTRSHIAEMESNEPVRCPLPPLVVLQENDRYFVVSGWHRTLAARKANLKRLPCYVLTDRAEAFRKGFEENSSHGQPLTRADRAHCISKVLEQHPDWTNRQVADYLGFGRRTTDDIIKRNKLRNPETKVVGKDGKSYSVNREVKASHKATEAELKWKLLLKSPPKDDEARSTVYRELVMAMNIDFVDQKYRDKFLKDIAEIVKEERA